MSFLNDFSIQLVKYCNWQTTLLLNNEVLVTKAHESPMYIQDKIQNKKRDNAFAKHFMVEFGKKTHTKYLRACLKIQPDLTIGIGLHI